MTDKEDLICIGIITTPHGIRGFCKVKYFTYEAENLTSYGSVFKENGEVIELKFKGLAKNSVICHIDGINTREEADLLRSEKLFVNRKNLPKLEEDEIYHIDLIGLTALDDKGVIIGKIENVLNYGAGDILQIDNKTEESLLLPFGPGLSKDLNFKNKTIVLIPPKQWLSINTEKEIENG